MVVSILNKVFSGLALVEIVTVEESETCVGKCDCVIVPGSKSRFLREK